MYRVAAAPDPRPARRGRHRRPRRWPHFLALAAAGSLVVLAVLYALGARDVAAHTSELAPADYNGWPAVTAPLCLEDHTGGFPVREAAAEFAGLVDVVVADDCAGYASRVWVITRTSEESWAGWYNSPNAERAGAALISLNLSQAYRLDTHGWRMLLVHEIGHALGLEHPPAHVDSVMEPTGYDDHYGLTPTDRSQLQELYSAAVVGGRQRDNHPPPLATAPGWMRRLGHRLHPASVTNAWYAAGCPRRLHWRAVRLRDYLTWRIASWLRGAIR